MIELIKELLKEGHKVTVIEVEASKTVTITTSTFDMPKPTSFKIKSVEVVDAEKVKRINWKTIKKIKECKEDGLTSAEAAKDLGLSVATVNKYWV
ncbi:MAG: hypothetical protein WC823_00100 [Parcubacteria group bacterium]|jgi:hypothetical protein